jgi:hypothetical protein
VTIKHEQSKTSRQKAQPAKARRDKWVLTLYVAGQTPKKEQSGSEVNEGTNWYNQARNLNLH